jgi:hypothetical protein
MNERIQELALQAGLTQAKDFKSGDEVKNFVFGNGLEKFAELIVNECCNRLSEETIRHDGYGYNQHELYNRLRKHFGVEE